MPQMGTRYVWVFAKLAGKTRRKVVEKENVKRSMCDTPMTSFAKLLYS